jgi:hypothetical protein
MKMLTGARALMISLALFASGCAVGGADDGIDGDDVTDEEMRAGEAWVAADGSEPDDHTDDGQEIADLEDTTTDEYGAQTTCRRATGYRRGVRFTICVVSIEGKWVEVNTARAYTKMRAAAARAGISIRIVSGFRTMAKQRELYACYRAGRCPLAAPPGYSNHQSGKALDLNTSAGGVYTWLSRNGSSYGFRRTVPSEKWHWER